MAKYCYNKRRREINVISITKPLCDSNNYVDSLRYVEGAALEKYGVSPGEVQWLLGIAQKLVI